MKCEKKMPLDKKGNDRGVCCKEMVHLAHCGNGTCYRCGIKLTKENANTTVVRKGSGRCRQCATVISQESRGNAPRNFQTLGSLHIFPCGCSGILPTVRSSNQFVNYARNGFSCRVTRILNSSQQAAKKFGHVPINPNTPHSTIRQMMQEKNCVICGDPLNWELGAGKTPQLHHSHETGEIHGFSHIKCNPLSEEREIFRLRERIKKLQQEIRSSK